MNTIFSSFNTFKKGGIIGDDLKREGGAHLTPEYYGIDGEKILFLGNPNGSLSIKFNRVAKIAANYGKFVNKLTQIIESNNKVPTNKEYNLAVATLAVISTGIRIGNESSSEGFLTTYKDKDDGKLQFAKTYGLTTIKKEHVKVERGIVKLDFTGKKHVQNLFTFSPYLSELIIPIINSNHNPVFGISNGELTSFIKKNTHKKLSSKDFRTFRANVYAYKKLASISKPKDKKQWKAKAKEVYIHVSTLLNNTEGVVKTSYIDPELIPYVFGPKETINKDEKSKKGD